MCDLYAVETIFGLVVEHWIKGGNRLTERTTIHYLNEMTTYN